MGRNLNKLCYAFYGTWRWGIMDGSSSRDEMRSEGYHARITG